MLRRFALGASAMSIASALASSTTLSFPLSQKGTNVVYSNFFGVSIELSIIDTLIGKDVPSIPPQFENYFTNIRAREDHPVRIRIGGNSMDDSVFNPAQSEMITFTAEAANINDQPVAYGPVLYDVLAEVAKKIGGAEYLIGLSLILHEQNDEGLVVSTAKSKLGDYLDGFLLGNEPDLYAGHNKRPANYTQEDYFGEFAEVSRELNSSATYGDLIPQPLLAGPTICCSWDLGDLLKAGYLGDFGPELKYLNLQHYPQNNCFGSHAYPIDYYLRHYEGSLVIALAKWQIDGVQAAHAANIPILMGEFNSASCGGIPGISDTFGATMWSVDYALQLASVGYSGAYIHTRERGITYNLFDPPAANGTSKDWTTLPTYYSLLPAAEALSGSNGSYVVDLNLNSNSQNSTVAGYSVYDATSGSPKTLVLFNYAEVGQEVATFIVPSIPADGGKRTLLVRTLTASSIMEKYNISWAGKTLLGVGDGIMVDSKLTQDQEVSCDSGCQVQVPSPGVAVVFLDSTKVASEPDPTSNANTPNSTNPANTTKNHAQSQSLSSLNALAASTMVVLSALLLF